VNNIASYVLQILAYATLAVALGYFSASPPYAYGSAEAAVIKVSLSHATERVAPCVRLTPEEVAALAPNMRRSESCERARLPLSIEIDVDGRQVMAINASPAGLWSDGPASVYRKLEFPPGEHRLSARLRDSARTDGWDYAYSENVRLEPGRYLTITFRAENGGFVFR
jgi:hypothetical protein